MLFAVLVVKLLASVASLYVYESYSYNTFIIFIVILSSVCSGSSSGSRYLSKSLSLSVKQKVRVRGEEGSLQMAP